MIVGLHSAGACETESFRDRCMYQRAVGWGEGHRYVPVAELDLLSGWVGGEVTLGWNTGKGEAVKLERHGNVIGRRFRTVD